MISLPLLPAVISQGPRRRGFNNGAGIQQYVTRLAPVINIQAQSYFDSSYKNSKLGHLYTSLALARGRFHTNIKYNGYN